MSTDRPPHPPGSSGIAYAAVPLAILSVVELAAYAPIADVVSTRIWVFQAAGTIALTLLVLLLGKAIRRSTRFLGRDPYPAAEINFAIAILLVAVAHAWFPLRSRSEQLLPWAAEWFRLTLLACTLVAGYVVACRLSRRLSIDHPRLLALMVASLAMVIGFGGAVRGAARADALADLRAPILLAGGAVFASTWVIGLLFRRRYHLLIGLPVLSGLIAMRALLGGQDGWVELAPIPATPADRPPVVFIVLDTFRADALDLREPSVSNTPHLAGLASVSDVYPNAIANGSWTLPGHASLFTGLTLSRHRTDQTAEPGFNPSLSPELATSHEVFARHGYRTVCITANAIVGMGSELARGCQRYNNPTRHWLTRLTSLGLINLVSESPFALQQLLLELTGIDLNANADEIVDLALEEIRGKPRGTYIFINFLDVHAPIYGTGGTDRPSLRSRLLARRDLLLRLFGLAEEAKIWNRHRDTLRAYYDSETRRLDGELGRLFATLEARGWFNEALIVVTSDHGEAFSENLELHSYFSHHSAYEPAVRIPLILKRPSQQTGARPIRRTQQIDVLPTLLDVVALPQVEGLDGRSVAEPALEPAITEWYRRPGEQSFPYLPHNRIGVYHDRFKYVMEGDGTEHLYDLELSPYEQVDVLDEHRQLAARLRSQAQESTKKPGPDPSVSGKPIDPRLMEQLRALGYAK